MPIRYAKLSKSDRLQRVYRLLADGEEHSTLEISIRCGVVAVSAIISEIRIQGAEITCRQTRSAETGARRWLYRMVTPAPAEIHAQLLKEAA
ncbi:MAG: hypothetical protein OXI69_15375 [Acidobacteriota bacterium]|nr:hypothetical protein [Acidobacteriota bacterium]